MLSCNGLKMTKSESKHFALYVQYDDLTEISIVVKCTLVQALRLCTGRMVHRGKEDYPK
jgi:hypothetical protein